MNSEDINNADLWVGKRSRSVEMGINHWVKAKTKGELRVPHRTLDAKNFCWSQIDIWEYQYQELDFGTRWAEVGRVIF